MDKVSFDRHPRDVARTGFAKRLKAEGADKASLAPAIEELVTLKAEYERTTGQPFDPPKKSKAKSDAAPGEPVPKQKVG